MSKYVLIQSRSDAIMCQIAKTFARIQSIPLLEIVQISDVAVVDCGIARRQRRAPQDRPAERGPQEADHAGPGRVQDQLRTHGETHTAHDLDKAGPSSKKQVLVPSCTVRGFISPEV